jgi:hypothetical protein
MLLVLLVLSVASAVDVAGCGGFVTFPSQLRSRFFFSFFFFLLSSLGVREWVKHGAVSVQLSEGEGHVVGTCGGSMNSLGSCFSHFSPRNGTSGS